MHSICARVKWVIPQCSRNLACQKCEGNVVEVMEQEGGLHNEVKAVKKFTCLGEMLGTDGGYKDAVSARAKRGLVEVRECGK